MALGTNTVPRCDHYVEREQFVLADLEPLVAKLRSRGYRVIGPTVRDQAIVLAELESAAGLPYGVAVVAAPGGYQLRRRDDRAAFAHAVGPQSWKSFLHPATERLMDIRRQPSGEFTVTEPTPAPDRYAFLGVRPCDLRAIGIQDRVLGQGAGSRYAARRQRTLLIAVNCTEPAATCFCAAVGTGPGVSGGADLVLTEQVDAEGEPHYLAQAGTATGADLLAELPHQPAAGEQVAAAAEAVAAAAGRMGRSLPPADLRTLLAGAAESGPWEELARQCLTCGNCTMVCPTCFCTTVTDTTDLTGSHAQRWQRWDSCFDLDFSYLHGGSVRSSAASRYRQWLTHKFSAWHDQFGEGGCVGCGRCIAWCPVGIDLTAQLHALAADADAAHAGARPDQGEQP